MIDFTNTPVIDAHAHPFMPSREKKGYERGFAMCIYPDPVNFKYQTSYHMALNELKQLFQMPNDTPDEVVVQHRQRLAYEDYNSFVKMLYKDAGITTILSDFGFPIVGDGLTDDELNTFYNATNGVCSVFDMIRIETTCDRHLYHEGLSFDEMVASFDQYVDQYIKKRPTICIKSVVGYYTGLKWEPVSHDEAEKNYNTYYEGRFNPKRTDKKFRDYMVYHSLELCVKYGLNFQMHTGAGDPPKCDMRLINPNDLYELINTDLAKQVHFVVIHAGFPYSYEAALLAACYPHVFTDVSSTKIYAGRSEEDVFRHILDICPHNKIMYASDGGGLVDASWYGARYTKRYMAQILSEYVRSGYFSDAYAQEIGEMILSKNAKYIYGI